MDRAMARTGSACLLERTRELEQIDRILAGAVGGDGRAMLIEGPAGMGKTTLLAAARRRGRELGATILAARGGELEAHFPFGVVRQLFEPLLYRASAESRAQLFAGAARLAEPVLSAAGDGASVGGDASAPLHGLYWLTVNLSVQAPVVIAVDDAHWADERSLRFLLYLVGRLEDVRTAVLVALRAPERGLGPSLAAQLLSDRTLEVLAPAGLSRRAVGELLATGLQQPPDAAFVDACLEATGGLPFLVHELVAALAADGVEPTAPRAADVRELGPRSVARATVVRLARTPPGCVALARSVAVLGGDATLPRAARLAGLQESAALTALDALVAAEVLQADAGLAFVHPILRAAIYDELAPGERSSLHRQSARLLAAEGAELDAVAAQLLATAPTGSSEVIAQLREAAALALARGAPEGAMAYLSRALAEGGERDLRAAISFELGTAARLAGRSAMFDHFTQAQRLATDPVLRNRAALELATALGLRGERDAPMALVQSALDDLGDREPELAVRLESFAAAVSASAPRLVGEFNRRLPALQDLVEQGGAAARSLALLLAAVASWRGEDARRVTALVDRGWDDGRLMAEGIDLWALGQAVMALVLSEQLAHAARLTDALLEDARARGSSPRFALSSAYRGLIEARCGRLVAAEGALRAAIDPARAEHAKFAISLYIWFAGDVILERPDAADLALIAEGKEVRFGPVASATWAAMTTATSNGSVNSMHDSLNPLAGMVPMALMMLTSLQRHLCWFREHADVHHRCRVHRRPDGGSDSRIPRQEGRVKEVKLAMLALLIHPLADLREERRSSRRRLEGVRRESRTSWVQRDPLRVHFGRREQRVRLRGPRRQQPTLEHRHGHRPAARPVPGPDLPAGRRRFPLGEEAGAPDHRDAPDRQPDVRRDAPGHGDPGRRPVVHARRWCSARWPTT